MIVIRWVAVAALLSLPPAGLVLLTNRAVDRVGTAVAENANAALAAYAEKRPPPDVPPVSADPCSAADGVRASALAKPPAKGRGSRSGAKGTASRRPATASRGVYVPSSAVLRLAQASAMPQAVPVGASGPRPAGLRLGGVGGLGIGMRDGDVLTRVMGGPAISVADVVGRVVAARAHRLPKISGEFWRDGDLWSLIVEQPYIAGEGVHPPP